MKTSYVVGIIVVLLLIAGVVVYTSLGTSPTTSETQTQPTAAPSATPAVPSGTQTSAAPAAQSFTVNGNDATADLKTITVPAGTPVSITFGADQGTTYHGGLDFRSSVVNTGTITPGSTKTITFTATKSFSFTPYWPATNIAKPYTIDIVVD